MPRWRPSKDDYKAVPWMRTAMIFVREAEKKQAEWEKRLARDLRTLARDRGMKKLGARLVRMSEGYTNELLRLNRIVPHMLAEGDDMDHAEFLNDRLEMLMGEL